MDYKANLAKQSKCCPILKACSNDVTNVPTLGMKEIEKAKLISKTTGKIKT